nr:MAG TPA: hypothetical protein [Caudoviricetes sp.]
MEFLRNNNITMNAIDQISQISGYHRNLIEPRIYQ